MMRFFRFLHNLFQYKRVPLYRIYENKWRIISKGTDDWDIEDLGEIPTPFVSDNRGVLLWWAIELRKKHYKDRIGDGMGFNFHVEKNRDLDKKGIWV